MYFIFKLTSGILFLYILSQIIISSTFAQIAPKTNKPINTQNCPSLPAPSGTIITISTESQLREQARTATANSTLLIEAGIYNMTDFVHVLNNQITIRGATANREDVILDFGGMVGGHFGILVDGDDFTIANLTIRNANDHGVSIQDRDRPTLYNLHIQDIGDQLVKVNPSDERNGSEDGLLACSRLEYTTTAPNNYTNGISAHNAHRWVIRDNEWYRIRTIDNTPVPTILFWSESSDTIVERNILIDCVQGISFGNASHSSIDHTGGIVRNNFIYSSLPHNVVIEMVHAQDWLVAHNTALLLNPSPGQTWGMEARFSDSQGIFAYNLTNMDIWPDRDGAQGILTTNITTAQSTWFTDASVGDLHLVATATDAIDQATSLTQITDDIDGDTRPIGSAPDIGADEYNTNEKFEALKTASLQTVTYAQAVTYTIVISHTPTPLTHTIFLTDTLPASLAYIPNTLTASSGTVDDGTTPTLHWFGTLSPTFVISITYVATIATTLPSIITNQAIIAKSSGQSITRSISIQANYTHIYLPFIIK